MPDRTPLPFYTTVELKAIRTYVTLANLCRALGFLNSSTNPDQRWPSLSFHAQEFYLSSIFRGKELNSNFEAVKTGFDQPLSLIICPPSRWFDRTGPHVNATNFWTFFQKNDLIKFRYLNRIHICHDSLIQTILAGCGYVKGHKELKLIVQGGTTLAKSNHG